jgi:hypothetical protein
MPMAINPIVGIWYIIVVRFLNDRNLEPLSKYMKRNIATMVINSEKNSLSLILRKIFLLLIQQPP